LFAVRWTGLVQPRLTDTYAFYTTSDDGVRLWVDNQLIIDNWTDHGPTENIGSIGLTAGQPYVIKMEYYENGGGAVAQLRWSATGLTKEIIPQTQLYPFTNTSLSISRQPQSTNVLKGRAASFSVAVTGFAPKTFQWYFNQTNLLGGATNISLSFAAVQLTNDGFYNVVVNDPNTTVTSAAARLGVFEGPGVVLPTNAVRTTITAGDSFTLSITTSGSIPMNYSWRRNFLGFTNFFLNSNVCTFTITNIQPASATALGTTNQYSVLLTNAANGVVSPPAQILTNIAFLKILNPPVITNQPLSVTTNAGAIVSFRVGAKGGSNQVNQWYFNSSRLTSATNTTLNLTNVQPANQGRYFATITNVDGMATSAVALLLIDTADFDGDGMSNANEIAAGTDPTDPNSYLRIDGFGLSNGIILQFFAVTNRSYGIDYRTDIGSGGSWSRLVDFPANSNANRTVSYTNAPLTTNQFYRLTTQKVQ